MNIEQLLNEHKKGVKAIKYSKKPTPLVGADALKKAEKSKKAPPKPEIARHKKLTPSKPAAKKPEPMGEGIEHGFDMRLAKILKQRGYKGPVKLEQLGMKWIEAIGDAVDTDDLIMVQGKDPNYDAWVSYVQREGKYAYGAEMGYTTGTAKRVEIDTRTEQGVEEGKIKIKIKHPPETAQEKLYKKHQEIRKKSGLPDPEEYKKKAAEKQKEIDDMKESKQPEAPKPRNFVAKNAKTAGAGKHKDAKKATKEVRGQKHKNKEMAENAMGKVVDYKPGISATIDTGPGMTTMLDLKKNPTSLTKDPQTGKLKLMPGTAATAQPSATTQSTVKPGDQVEMPKTNTMAAEDILRLAGLR